MLGKKIECIWHESFAAFSEAFSMIPRIASFSTFADLLFLMRLPNSQILFACKGGDSRKELVITMPGLFTAIPPNAVHMPQLLLAPPLAARISSILATRFLNSSYWHFSYECLSSCNSFSIVVYFNADPAFGSGIPRISRVNSTLRTDID